MAQAITTKFAGPTNSQGSRIIVKSWKGRTVYSWDHALNSNQNHAAAIDEHIKRKLVTEHTADWWCLAMGEQPDSTGYVAIVQLTTEGNALSASEWMAA